MRKLIVMLVLIISLLITGTATARCIAGQNRIDRWTTLVLVDINCDGYIDAVETWKWNGNQWILVFVRPY